MGEADEAAARVALLKQQLKEAQDELRKEKAKARKSPPAEIGDNLLADLITANTSMVKFVRERRLKIAETSRHVNAALARLGAELVAVRAMEKNIKTGEIEASEVWSIYVAQFRGHWIAWPDRSCSGEWPAPASSRERAIVIWVERLLNRSRWRARARIARSVVFGEILEGEEADAAMALYRSPAGYRSTKSRGHIRRHKP